MDRHAEHDWHRQLQLQSQKHSPLGYTHAYCPPLPPRQTRTRKRRFPLLELTLLALSSLYAASALGAL